MRSGDIAWLLISAALVLFMTPGLALFYGGMVRSKNVLSVIMQSFLWLIAKGIDRTMGLRVTPEDEFTGLDLTQHAESAYSMGGTGRIGG